jgi:hypothetical protein
MSETAEVLMTEAEEFCQKQTDVWLFMQSYAVRCVREKRRFSAVDLCVAVKGSGMLTHSDGRPKSYKNSLRAPLFRLTLAAVPAAIPFAIVAKSKTDTYFTELLDGRRAQLELERRAQGKAKHTKEEVLAL